jgi:acylphosphatase
LHLKSVLTSENHPQVERIKLIIEGRVQGVAYRAHARRKALSLGLSGFVENRPDGSVYAEVEGPPDLLGEMVEWCRKGPALAQVKDVRVEDVAPTGANDFEIRR